MMTMAIISLPANPKPASAKPSPAPPPWRPESSSPCAASQLTLPEMPCVALARIFPISDLEAGLAEVAPREVRQ